MSVRPGLARGILVRVIISVGLAAAALTLFLLQRSHLERPPEVRQRNVREMVAAIDREVDTVLVRFRIEPRWVRKSQVPIPNAEISRTERRILTPPELVPVQMNQVLNAMARRYAGRAIASENLKENSVTIHIELEGYIVQTLILKPNPELRREAQTRRPKKT
jgi:hypothetical protein